MNTARKLYRITRNAITRELSRRWGAKPWTHTPKPAASCAPQRR